MTPEAKAVLSKASGALRAIAEALDALSAVPDVGMDPDQQLSYAELSRLLELDPGFLRDLGRRGLWPEIAWGARAVRVRRRDVVAAAERLAQFKRQRRAA